MKEKIEQLQRENTELQSLISVSLQTNQALTDQVQQLSDLLEESQKQTKNCQTMLSEALDDPLYFTDEEINS